MPQINRDYKLLSYPLLLKSILISYSIGVQYITNPKKIQP